MSIFQKIPTEYFEMSAYVDELAEKSAIKKLLKLAQKKSLSIKVDTLINLGGMGIGSTEVVDKNEDLRKEVIMALRDFNDPRVIRVLTKISENDEIDEIRSIAKHALLSLGVDSEKIK